MHISRSIPWSLPGGILLLPLLLSGCTGGGPFPNQPITIICPWSIGGGTNAVSRALAVELERAVGQPVVVSNRTGGGGAIGHTAGARARPDGYTLTMMTIEITTMHRRGLTRISPDDFAPIMLVNYDSAALFVRSDAPWENLEQLLDDVRARPEELQASGTALGGIWHLACMKALLDAGLPHDAVLWVPSPGAGPALLELEAGGVHLVFCSLPEAATRVRDGKLRCLGVMSPERISGYADIPTFREEGLDSSLRGWRGVAAPRDTPPEILASIEGLLRTVVEGEEFPLFMKNMGFDFQVETGEVLRETIAETSRVLGGLVELTTGSGGKGPWFFPSILGVLLVLALVMAFRGSRAAGRALPSLTLPRTQLFRLLELVGAVVFFIYLAGPLGFTVALGLPILYLLLRLGSSLISSILVSAALTPAVYFLFAGLFRVALPRGPWGF